MHCAHCHQTATRVRTSAEGHDVPLCDQQPCLSREWEVDRWLPNTIHRDDLATIHRTTEERLPSHRYAFGTVDLGSDAAVHFLVRYSLAEQCERYGYHKVREAVTDHLACNPQIDL